MLAFERNGAGETREIEPREEVDARHGSIGSWDHDISEGMVHWSDRAKTLCGLSREKTPSFSTFIAAVHPEDRGRVTEAIEKAHSPQTGGVCAISFRCIGIDDGIERRLWASGRVFFDERGNPHRASGIVLDITAHYRWEEELRQRLAKLSRAKEEVEEMTGLVSHDLKEPIRMVSCFLRRIAQRGLVGTSEGREMLQFALDGAQLLKEQVEALIDYAQLEGENLRPGPLALREALEPALTNLRLLIEETGATIVVESDLPLVLADKTLLVQVFQNLLANALQNRGADPPKVRVRADCGSRNCLISIRDNGVGFSMKHAERIFLLFQQLKSNSPLAGVGAGLAICKKILEKMGGRIWAESEPGQGATFYFSLPLWQEGGAPQ